MANKSKPISRTNRSAPPVAHQRAIAEQTAAFLASGGKIQKIPSGVSGQAKLGGPMFTTQTATANTKTR